MKITGEDPIDAWAAHLTRQGRAPDTVRVRRACMRTITNDLGDLLELDGDAVADWIIARSPKAETRRQYVHSVRAFAGWAADLGLLRSDPRPGLPRVRAPRGVPHPTPGDVVQALLQLPDPGDRACVLLGAYAGLRVSEMARARPDDLERVGSGWRIRVIGKGGVERLAPVPSWAVAEVRPLLPVGRAPTTITHRIGRAVRAAGGTRGAHTLRHAYATALLSSCHDLRIVQEALGHASPATTAIYTLVDSDAATAAVEAMPRPRLRAVA